MSRQKQVFVAPGPEGQPLGASPWLRDREVRIPLEYWYLVEELAERLDPAAAERLAEHSGTLGLDGDTIPFDAAAVGESIAFLGRLADELGSSPPLVPEPDDEFPEGYPNETIAEMVRDVRTVLEESARRGEPFRAWNE
jgi:hypothetical protein